MSAVNEATHGMHRILYKCTGLVSHGCMHCYLDSICFCSRCVANPLQQSSQVKASAQTRPCQDNTHSALCETAIMSWSNADAGPKASSKE